MHRWIAECFSFVSGDSNGYEVFDRQQLGFKSLTNFKHKIKFMPIDIDKAKQALVTLQEERQAQQDRLQLAAQAKAALYSINKPNSFKIMMIDVKLLDDLSAQTRVIPRLRHYLDLRTILMDHSQRMLNALEPGNIMPINRHCNCSETMRMIRACLVEFLYDEKGNVRDKILMRSNCANPMKHI